MDVDSIEEAKGFLILPPSPNWYCSSIGECLPNGILAFGARNNIVLLNLVSQRVEAILDGHSNRVSAVDFSSQLVSGSLDKSVIVWNLNPKLHWRTSKRILKQHKEHKNEITSVTCSRSSNSMIVSGDKNGLIVVWDSSITGSIRSTKPISSAISVLKFHPTNSDIVAVGYQNGLVGLFCISEFKLNHLFPPNNSGAVQSIDWSINSELATAGDIDKSFYTSILAWTSSDKKLNLTEVLFEESSYKSFGSINHIKIGSRCNSESQKSWSSVHWSKSSLLLYYSNPNGEIFCVDSVKPSKPVKKVSSIVINRPSHSKQVENSQLFFYSFQYFSAHPRSIFLISSYENRLVTISMDRSIAVWAENSSSGFIKCSENTTLGGYAYHVHESPTEPGLMAIACGDNAIRIWSIEPALLNGEGVSADEWYKTSNSRSKPTSGSLSAASLLWKGIACRVTFVQWHPVCPLIAYGLENGQVGIYDVDNQTSFIISQVHSQPIYQLLWLPADPQLINLFFSQANSEIANEESDTKKSKSKNRPQTHILISLAGDGHIFASYPLKNFQPVNVNEKLSVRCSDSAQASKETLLEQISKSCGKTYNSFPKRTSATWKEGHIVLSNSDGSQELYSFPSLEFITSVRNHTKFIQCTSWSPFENYLASSCEGTIHIHLLTPDGNFKLFQTFYHSKGVNALMWSPFLPNILASSSSDTTVQIWDIAQNKGIVNLRNHTTPVLSLTWSKQSPNILLTGGEDHIGIFNFTLKTEFTMPPTKETDKSNKNISDIPLGSPQVKNSSTNDSKHSSKKDNVPTSSTLGGKSASKLKLDLDWPRLSSSSNSYNDIFQLIHRTQNNLEVPLETPESCPVVDCRHTTKTKLSTDTQTFSESNTLFDYHTLNQFICEYGINELKESSTSIETKLLLKFWEGQISEVFAIVLKLGLLNEMWVSLAPAGGASLWRKVTSHYAEMLVTKGDFHRAAQYYLSIHEIEKAICVYESAYMFPEAITLATQRYGPMHETLKRLYINWSNFFAHRFDHLMAAKCLIAIGSYDSALQRISLVDSIESSIVYFDISCQRYHDRLYDHFDLLIQKFYYYTQKTSMVINCLLDPTFESILNCRLAELKEQSEASYTIILEKIQFCINFIVLLFDDDELSNFKKYLSSNLPLNTVDCPVETILENMNSSIFDSYLNLFGGNNYFTDGPVLRFWNKMSWVFGKLKSKFDDTFIPPESKNIFLTIFYDISTCNVSSIFNHICENVNLILLETKIRNIIFINLIPDTWKIMHIFNLPTNIELKLLSYEFKLIFILLFSTAELIEREFKSPNSLRVAMIENLMSQIPTSEIPIKPSSIENGTNTISNSKKRKISEVENSHTTEISISKKPKIIESNSPDILQNSQNSHLQMASNLAKSELKIFYDNNSEYMLEVQSIETIIEQMLA